MLLIARGGVAAGAGGDAGGRGGGAAAARVLEGVLEDQFAVVGGGDWGCGKRDLVWVYGEV